MNSPTRRIFNVRLLAIAIALGSTAIPSLAEDGDEAYSGRVFTSTNATGNNELLVYASAQGGGLNLVARVSTQGQGSGSGLGSQGAVTLSTDGRYVFVVNAGSSTVSTFALRGPRVELTSVIDSGGQQPISVTENDGIVVVLNALGNGNIAGFRNVDGQLKALPDGVRGLSAAAVMPAQVGFAGDGDVLVVTEKGTNKLTSYRAGRNGTLGQPVVTASAGITPFGFAFDRRDHLVVSEAFGGAVNGSAASSYRFDERNPVAPVLVSPSVPTHQTAACWVAITPNGKFAYTGNATSNSISSYRIARNGSIELVEAAAGSTGANASVNDLAVSSNGRYLYALAPRSLQIVSFKVSYDGSLRQVGAATGLPAGSVGLAAN